MPFSISPYGNNLTVNSTYQSIIDSILEKYSPDIRTDVVNIIPQQSSIVVGFKPNVSIESAETEMYNFLKKVNV
jgi:hypothetical protein